MIEYKILGAIISGLSLIFAILNIIIQILLFKKIKELQAENLYLYNELKTYQLNYELLELEYKDLRNKRNEESKNATLQKNLTGAYKNNCKELEKRYDNLLKKYNEINKIREEK